jgi:hypothetical protein
MRSGRISHSRLKQRSPKLAAAHEAYLRERHQPHPPPDGARGAPTMLEGFTLAD